MDDMEECLMSSTESSKFDRIIDQEETCQVKPDPEGERSSQLITAPRNSVRFSDETQVHQYEGVRKEERCDVWYKREHYTMFRREIAYQAALVQKRDQREGSWSNSLITAYLVIRENKSVEEVLAALNDIQAEINEEHVGITPFAIPSITRDSNLLRRHLSGHIKKFQEATRGDGIDRSKMIAETSRQTSRSSRLFAQYTAQLAAESI
eukprot:scaffold3571_cov176-Amphora_coffeaeformis.AAC.2